MKTSRATHSLSRGLLSAAVLLAASSSILGCGGSSVTNFDPAQIAANFAVYRQTTETPTQLDAIATQTVGGAIFYQGFRTLNLEDTLVEVVDPTGAAHAMGPSSSPNGAFYYSVELPNLQLNSTYTFRVTLSDGRVIANSITTPQNDLAITVPALNANIAKNSAALISWTGTNAGNFATLVFKQLTTPDIFTVYAALGVLANDNGNYLINPASTGMEHSDTGVGPRLLTITRRNDSGVNGFSAASICRAALVTARQVNLTEPVN